MEMLASSRLMPGRRVSWRRFMHKLLSNGRTLSPNPSGGCTTSKFNFGMSKVLNGRLYLYAFSVDIVPTPELRKLIGAELSKSGTVGTSAWLPLDRVVQKEALLDRVGVGKVKLPRLPLMEKGF